MLRTLKRIFRWIDGAVAGQLPLFLTFLLLLTLPSLLFYQRGHLSVTPIVYVWSLFMYVSVAGALCCICKVPRLGWLRWVFMGGIFVASFVIMFLAFAVDAYPSPELVNLILLTDRREASEFINHYVLSRQTLIIVGVLLVSFLPLAISALVRRRSKDKPLKVSSVRGLAIVMIMVSSATAQVFCINVKARMDKETIISLMQDKGYMSYLRTALNAGTTISSLFDFIGDNDNYPMMLSDIRKANSDIVIDSCAHISPTIVLVIGESDGRRHSSLYGYEKQTMPNMEREAESGRVFTFDSIYTRYIMTYKVMREILSTATDSLTTFKRPLLPIVMTEAGYDVRFFDNHTTKGIFNQRFDIEYNFILRQEDIAARSFSFRNAENYEFDNELVELSRRHLSDSAYRFYMYHLMGQHDQARFRTPDSLRIFKPTDYVHRADSLTGQMMEELAAYDNATLNLDRNLGQIIDMVRDDEAIMVYLPDHGDEAYDFRLNYGRTLLDSPENYDCLYHLPMMVWVSDSYRERHPDIVAALESAKGRRWINSDVSQLIMALAGIKAPFCSPDHTLIKVE